jgi:hypothetical protein
MSTRTYPLLALFAAVSLAAPSSSVAQSSDAEEVFRDLAANELRVRDISFGTDLAREGDMALVGINAVNSVRFGLPDYWDVQGSPELHLDVARSAMLIPDVSAITVWADGRPVGTFSLDGDPAEVDRQVMKLPLQAKNGYHSLQFWAYHRSRLPCELSDHPGLWSRILESSFVRVTYRPKTPELSLSDWPYPFRDDRDPDPARVVLLLADDPTAEEVKAAGYLASFLGHISGWRPMDLYVHQGSLATAPAGHIIAVGRADVPGTVVSDVRELLGGRPEAELSQAADRIRANNLPKSGLLTLAPRSPGSMRSVLGVIGRDGEGLVNLARMLSSEESSTLSVGIVESIEELSQGKKMEARRWTNTVPPETSFTLADLGNDDRMAMGYHGGTVSIPLNLVPDDHPVPGSARFELNYSYSAQADPTNSRLDVFLNGAAVGGVALDEVDGRNHVKLLLELPVHEMGPESRLDVRFALLQKEEPTCIGEDREHLWGTVHSDSRLTMPRDRWARIPDLSLVRYGAYPFGLHPDLSETVFVLPSQPSRTELQLFAWLSAELGRVARGDRFAYDVRVGALTREATEGRDIIVIDSGPQGALIQKMGLLDSMSFTPRGTPGVSLALASGGMVALGADPRVAYFEEMILPWNKDRAALVAYAAEPKLFERVGRCLNGSPLFDRLKGRVTRVASCTDLAAIPVEEARVIGERPVREAAYEPIRNNYWLILAGIALLVFVALVLRAFWLALGRSDDYDVEDGMQGEAV